MLTANEVSFYGDSVFSSNECIGNKASLFLYYVAHAAQASKVLQLSCRINSRPPTEQRGTPTAPSFRLINPGTRRSMWQINVVVVVQGGRTYDLCINEHYQRERVFPSGTYVIEFFDGSSITIQCTITAEEIRTMIRSGVLNEGIKQNLNCESLITATPTCPAIEGPIPRAVLQRAMSNVAQAAAAPASLPA